MGFTLDRDRVLARHGLVLAGNPRPGRSHKTPWPEWCEWAPNQLWCWDASQFEACTASNYAYGIIDLVSRKWIATTLTAEPTSLAARVLFTKALDAEGLLTDNLAERLSDLDAELPSDDESVPLLLAICLDRLRRYCGARSRVAAREYAWPCAPTGAGQRDLACLCSVKGSRRGRLGDRGAV